MSKIVAVHGIGQQYLGEEQLKREWLPALKDGLARAGAKKLSSDDDLFCAFYGDIFRPPGKAGGGSPSLDSEEESWDAELLQGMWAEAARVDESVSSPDAQAKVGTPNLVQRALLALSNSKFFAGLTTKMMALDLKQVRNYLHDPQLRAAIQGCVVRAVTPETRILIGHSLGSIVAYEAACAHPEWTLGVFLTLGSPLGIPNLIFQRLVPKPESGVGAWPRCAARWVNLADGGDIVALQKKLASCFGDRVEDHLIHNGAKAHDATRYLDVRETGEAIGAVL
jgi:hypothetical protein